MARATILLLLACGGIVIQADSFDANANPNILRHRRDINANANMNILGHRRDINANPNMNILGYRRDINANPNMNILSHRRDINANANMNIIGRRTINANANMNIIARRNINAGANNNMIGRRNINAASNMNIIGRRTINAGSNMNIIGRRNINANANMNIIGHRNSDANTLDDGPIIQYDDLDYESDMESEKMPRKMYNENPSPITSLAVAAGDAAYNIMRDFTSEMTENAADAVADVVATILKRQNILVPYSRRNANANCNTNILQARRRSFEGSSSTPEDLAESSQPGDSGSGLDGHADAYGGRYVDTDADQEEQEGEVVEVEETPRDVEVLKDDVEENEIVARRTFGGHSWDYPSYDWGRNSNANSNLNMISSYHPKLRRHINANSNLNIIGHRRTHG